ncbi:MAG: cysteine--tRNA ligase [Patescibacteria group bacterium]
MAEIYLTNTLTQKKEKFIPINPSKIGMYTCGPTVYDFASIGNFRTYFTADILLRLLKYLGYEVDYVMNLTDVGHLTGDNLGDADMGEDRIEKKAKVLKKSAWDISEQFTEEFIKDFEKLNLTKPKIFSKATDHLKEQIDFVKKLEEKGFTYKISDGIYFNTKFFEEKTGSKYGQISDLDQIKEGARVEINPDKKNPRDFALWKFSPKDSKRQMEWESPWGKGFPGWHIECSAMSMKYLGESFDIHLGGEDLKQTHHPNEIAQSEALTGKKFVNYWLHTTFLKIDGKRMGKSLGNFLTVSDLVNKGFDPLSLRYLFLTANYRDTLNFTWQGLSSAQNSLNKLKEFTLSLKNKNQRFTLSREKEIKIEEYRDKFIQNISDDLNTAKAMAVLWGMLKSNISSYDKYDLLMSFDEVLGFNLAKEKELILSDEIKDLSQKREDLRKLGKFDEADKIRKQINKKGYKLEDTKEGILIKPVQNAKIQ